MSIVLNWFDSCLIVPLDTDYCGDLSGGCNFDWLFLLLFVFFLVIFLLVNLDNYCMLLLSDFLLLFLILHNNILFMLTNDVILLNNLSLGIFNRH
jgi:hypothetical protein